MKGKIAWAAALAVLATTPANAGQETVFETWEECVGVASAVDMAAWSATCAPKAGGGWVIAWAKKRKR